MTLLRWLIGLGSALGLAAFVLIMVVGKGIRSAYQSGAGVANLVRDIAVYAIPLLLAAMLASVFLPQSRNYLHAVAAGVLLAMAGCLTLLPEHTGEGLLYLGFFALWMVYYFLAAWSKG